jgi:hypothetical protein
MYNMTAVEWVFDKMLDIAAGNSSLTTQEILEKGRDMEREQIITAYGSDRYPCSDEDAEQYYNQTYKGKQ